MPRALDRSSPVPCYVQILQQLRDEVLTLPDGRLVASERELADRYGVSRMTAREAVRILRQEGLVYHERGRGMFVRPRKLDLHERHVLAGFTEEMRRARALAGVAAAALRSRPRRGARCAARCGCAAGEPVYRIERLRLPDEAPMALRDARMCRSRSARDSIATTCRARRSIASCARTSALQLVRAAEELEAASAGRTIAQLFRTVPVRPRPHHPPHRLRAVGYSRSKRPARSIARIAIGRAYEVRV